MISERHGSFTRRQTLFYRVSAVLVSLVIVGILLYTVAFLPPFGAADNPGSNEVVDRYIEKGIEETGAVNLVAGMILDYRAFDTFGESCVLFLGVISVIMLLKTDKNNKDQQEERERIEDKLFARMQTNVILQTIARMTVPIVMLFGLYVILNGHLSLGGGFSGGAIMGAGLVLYANAYGFTATRRFFNEKVFTAITTTCLLIYCLAKGYSFFTGANHLESGIPLGTPGAILSAGLILPLNICVGFIVACTVYSFYALFSRGDI